MSQLSFSFKQSAPKKTPSVRRFLRRLKNHAFEIVHIVITLLLLAEFSIKEIALIVKSILQLLGFL